MRDREARKGRAPWVAVSARTRSEPGLWRSLSSSPSALAARSGWRPGACAEAPARTIPAPRQRSPGRNARSCSRMPRGAGASGLPMRGKLASQRPGPPSWELNPKSVERTSRPIPAARRRTYVNRSMETTRTSCSTRSRPRARTRHRTPSAPLRAHLRRRRDSQATCSRTRAR